VLNCGVDEKDNDRPAGRPLVERAKARLLKEGGHCIEENLSVDVVRWIVDLFLHVDEHLEEIKQLWGVWIYVVLFAIVFCETGLVITPFLPGDSLLFAAGSFAAIGSLDVKWLFILLSVAAILGDTVNYPIGQYIGLKAFQKNNSRFFKKEYLDKTHRFYEKYGAKTVILARFVPIIRTFAPFMAGAGAMQYSRFIKYNIVGALIWVGLFVFSGYYIGNISIVKENFSIVILAIIGISLVPAIVEFLRHRK